MKKLLFITWNQNKIKEASLYLPWFEIETAWVEVPEIQSVDVKEVIIAKLQSAYSQIKKPCFVMDASLVIEWLCKKEYQEKKFPWALIKDVFWNMWAENITKLVQINQNTNCKWTAMIWYFDGEKQYYFESSLNWNISNFPIWMNWYDWDTIFIPIWETRTFAQMSFEEKHKYALTKNLYKQFYDFLVEKL